MSRGKKRCAGGRNRPADCLCELPCTLARVRARVFGAHIARMQDPTAELARIRRDVLGALWFPDDTPRIRNNLSIYNSNRVFQFSARHGAGQSTYSRSVLRRLRACTSSKRSRQSRNYQFRH
jgi:hypothetical protein